MEVGSEMTRTPDCACVNCGRVVDAATSVGSEASPDPGDVTICLYCGHLMAFTDALTLRDLNDQEIIECAGDPRIIAIQKARGKLPFVKRSVFNSLDAVCEDGDYPAQLAELSDTLQAEDLIDKTDVADCVDAAKDETELLVQVTAFVKEWRGKLK